MSAPASVVLPRISPLWSTYRGLRYPRSPLGSLEAFGARAGDVYEVYAGSRGWSLVTDRPSLIDAVFRREHRNFGKSTIVTELLASYIGKGLLTSDGDYWRQQRRLIQPGFSRERLARLVNDIDGEVHAWVTGLPTGTDVDLYPTTLPLALQIMSRVLFSGRVTDAELHTIANAVELGQRDLAAEMRQPLLKPWRRLTNSRAAADAETRRSVDILLRQIAEHRGDARTYDDLLQMLLEARYDDGTAMSDAQLVDETLVLILAGHETTAITLACTLWLLSKSPEWCARIRAEWREVVGVESLTAAHLHRLPVLTAVLREGLRLYPPAYLVSRVAREAIELEGIRIRAGQTVLLNIYSAHRHPSAFVRPNAFRPERYLERETTTNFAFGGGPRLCVGYHLAMMELQIAVGRLLTTRSLAASAQADLSFTASATLRPEGGTRVSIA